MEHRIILAVFAKEGHVLAQVHILQMISNKTPIATLNAFTKLSQYFLGVRGFHKKDHEKFNISVPLDGEGAYMSDAEMTLPHTVTPHLK